MDEAIKGHNDYVFEAETKIVKAFHHGQIGQSCG
jgi:hypothetical protein